MATSSSGPSHDGRPAPPDSVTATSPAEGASAAGTVTIVDLGRMPYAQALAVQREALDAVVAAREAIRKAELESAPGRRSTVGCVHLVEHDPPVVTVTRRPGVAEHLLASPERLASMGIEVQETDRGGDITYHGPGQLVVYPVLDLNALGLRIHGYMRFLEEVVIRTLAAFGLEGWRDPQATGVWVGGDRRSEGARSGGAKICALGVRVSRWVSMHGLALNVDPDLAHFSLIVPCGLHGRGVTSLRRELGSAAPTMSEVKAVLIREMVAMLEAMTIHRVAGSDPAEASAD